MLKLKELWLVLVQEHRELQSLMQVSEASLLQQTEALAERGGTDDEGNLRLISANGLREQHHLGQHLEVVLPAGC